MNTVLQWKQWLVASNRAAGTIALRVAHVTRALDAIGRDLSDITVDDVAHYLASQPWAPATRRSYRASLSAFFAYAHARGLATFDGADLPAAPTPRSVPRPASDQMIREALARGDERAALMIELMAYGGLRRCEVATVKGADVTGQWLHVVGKGGHTRMVPLPRHLAARLRRVPGWAFPGAIDGHLSARRVGEIVGALLPDGVTAHALRHRYATRVYQRSGDIRAVQTLLGHAKLDTTMIYVAVHDDARMTAAATAWEMTA